MRVPNEITYGDVERHRGHEITAEADDITANVICDECGEIIASTARMAPQGTDEAGADQ